MHYLRHTSQSLRYTKLERAFEFLDIVRESANYFSGSSRVEERGIEMDDRGKQLTPYSRRSSFADDSQRRYVNECENAL